MGTAKQEPSARAVLAVRLVGIALLLTILGLGLASILPKDLLGKAKSQLDEHKEVTDKVLAVLASPDAPPPVSVTQEVAPAPISNDPPQASVWTFQVTSTGGVRVMRDNAAVLTSAYASWMKGWKWVKTDIKAETRDADHFDISGEIPGLGVQVSGTADVSTEDQITLTWLLDVAEPLVDIVGTVMEFRLNLNSSAHSVKPGTPELLPDYRGWRWEVAPGEVIEASFSEALPNVYFERNDPSKIRMQLIGSTLDQGSHTRIMTLRLPAGTHRVPTAAERYGKADTSGWHANALLPGESPVDLRRLNHRPAGSKGFVRAEGDRLVFEDGTEARFWGGNLAAYTLFWPDKDIEHHAERIAKLGYNLMRFHHHDSSGWVNPSVLNRNVDNSLTFNDFALDRVDYWIKCLKEQGVYVWVDLHVGRVLKEGDQSGPRGAIEGFEEIERNKGSLRGFNYYNDTVRALMTDFNETYLTRVSPYTGLAFKDEPAIMGFLITNENDLVQHLGNLMLPDKNNPIHNKLFEEAVTEYAQKHGLDRDKTWRTWEPGPSKLFLNDREYQFNRFMLDHLTGLGVRVPVATTNYWGDSALFCLPALTSGSIIDIHSYGAAEFLSSNPRHAPSFISWIACGQVYGMPTAITEWNVPYPATDRFIAPLYVASIAALQGWDAPMIYTYSQENLAKPGRASTWSTYYDPAFQAAMPAAALMYRERHVRPALTEYCLQLSREQLFFEQIDPGTSVALRTLAETSKLTIGLPDAPELEWDRATQPASGVTILDDPQADFLPEDATEIVSDTGELRRDWVRGIHTIDTPRTIAAAGWFEGKPIEVGKARFEVTPPKALVAVTSLDEQPLADSGAILITTIARVKASSEEKVIFLSEPVAGTLSFPGRAGLTVYPLNPDGSRRPAIDATYEGGCYTLRLDGVSGTHWYMLE